MSRVRIQGFVTDRTTARAFAEAQRLYGAKMRITQGSFSHGALSAGTHSGAGALDLSVRGLSRRNINRMVRALRRVGLWAWYRDQSSGFTPHVHAIRVGAKGAAPIARAQIAAARKGYNGLGHLGMANKDRHRGMHLSVTSYRYYKRHKRST